jgi:hypothetical protein
MGGSRHLFDILNERGEITYAEISKETIINQWLALLF